MKYTVFSTPQGYCAAVEDKGKLAAFYLPVERYDTAVNRVLSEHPGAKDCETELLKEVEAIVDHYFSGGRADFSHIPAIEAGGSEFASAVLDEVRKIPYGETVSYKKLAEKAGMKGSARAAGNALNKNPLPLIIPCHRVIKNSGELGGYNGGPGWKVRLLKLEKAI